MLITFKLILIISREDMEDLWLKTANKCIKIVGYVKGDHVPQFTPSLSLASGPIWNYRITL